MAEENSQYESICLLDSEAEVEELYDAVVNGRPVFHDGRWGEATLEVCLAILESSEQRKEIFLSHQVPSPDCSS